MVDRTLVPANARMSQTNGDGATENATLAVRTKLLVPRHLAPANAKMPPAEPCKTGGDGNAAAKRDLAVRRTLVPANAQIGGAQNQTSTLEVRGVGTHQSLFKLDEALLEKAFAQAGSINPTAKPFACASDFSARIV
jgi:hypothetical protein